MSECLKQQLVTSFEENFSGHPVFITHAPGRVNLIGEHTDYNDGFVMPMAIERAVWITLRPIQEKKVRLFSLGFNAWAEFDLTSLINNGQGWIEYIKGIAAMLDEAGYPLVGWEGVIASNIPVGAGLSSSAALELAAARAFSAAGKWDWEPKKMALLAQRAENQWVGVNCGIMDQLISAAGINDHALMIDCRTLETTPAPLPPGCAVIILDTSTRRGLVDSEYNLRRQSCEKAAAYFDVEALRDVTPQIFAEKADGLDAETRSRARHIITENERVLKALEAMQNQQPEVLGELMKASHTSLKEDYEVSRRELDLIVELSNQHPDCYGARMTGAGFGGCAIALIKEEQAINFSNFVSCEYLKFTGLKPSLYLTQARAGASLKKLNEA